MPRAVLSICPINSQNLHHHGIREIRVVSHGVGEEVSERLRSIT